MGEAAWPLFSIIYLFYNMLPLLYHQDDVQLKNQYKTTIKYKIKIIPIFGEAVFVDLHIDVAR